MTECFFISYNSADREPAEWIAWTLRDEGHEVIFAPWENAGGTDLGDWLLRRLDDADRMICVTSPDYLKPEAVYSAAERAAMAWAAIGERRNALIVTMIADCPIPRLLGARLKIDLIGLDRDAARPVLLRGLYPDPIPDEEPAFVPGGTPVPGAASRPDWPLIAPPDISPDRHVIGREELVAELRAALHAGKDATIVPAVTIKGQGGMGKTTLARHYADLHRADYAGLWWLGAQTEPSLIDDLCRLADQFKLRPGDYDTRADRALAAVAEIGRRREPWLLVFDNAEDPKLVGRYRPDGAHVHAIVTTREGGWPARKYRLLEAGRLSEEAATDLLLQEAEREGPREEARRLAVETLDRLPLAIVLAGAWLRDTTTGYSAYAEALASRIALAPTDVGVLDYPDSVFGAVMLSVEKCSENARLLLKVFAFLAPDDIWPGLVTALAEKGPEHDYYVPVPDALWALARDAETVERAFAALVRRSLIEHVEDDGHAIHRLTQAVQRAALGTEGPAWRDAAAAAVAAGYPGGAKNPAYPEQWPLCARLGGHVEALAEAGAETAAMDYLLNQAGIYLDRQGDYDRALAYAERSLALTEARLGPDHATVGTACSNLAARYLRLGRVGEAEPHAARAVAIDERTPAVPETARAVRLSVHGLVLHALGEAETSAARAAFWRRAARRFQAALVTGLRVPGSPTRYDFSRLNNLATLRAAQGRWGAALRLQGRTLALRRQELPAGDPDIAVSLFNIGATLLKAGRARRPYRGEAALDLIAEALAIHEATFPDKPRHPYRVASANWLAKAHLTLAALGASEADTARADALIAEYDLDRAVIETAADLYTRRARAHEAGEPLPET